MTSAHTSIANTWWDAISDQLSSWKKIVPTNEISEFQIYDVSTDRQTLTLKKSIVENTSIQDDPIGTDTYRAYSPMANRMATQT